MYSGISWLFHATRVVYNRATTILAMSYDTLNPADGLLPGLEWASCASGILAVVSRIPTSTNTQIMHGTLMENPPSQQEVISTCMVDYPLLVISEITRGQIFLQRPIFNITQLCPVKAVSLPGWCWPFPPGPRITVMRITSLPGFLWLSPLLQAGFHPVPVSELNITLALLIDQLELDIIAESAS